MNEMWNIADFYQAIPEFKLEDISGRNNWKQIFGGCCISEELSDTLYLPKAQYFLICGACGTGKETLAQAAAGEFGASGYRLLSLYTDDLLGENSSQTKAHITALFQEITTSSPIILIWEELDQLKDRSVILHLCRKLNDAGQRNLPVIVLATAESEADIPMQLRKMFVICRLENPDKQERTEYFESQISPVLTLEAGLNSQIMAEMTEGFSYAELDHTAVLVKALFSRNAKKKCASEELLAAMVKSGQLVLTKAQFETAVCMVKPMSEPEVFDKEANQTEREKQSIQKEELVKGSISDNQTLEVLAQLILSGQNDLKKPEIQEEEDKDPAKEYRKADGSLSEDIDPFALLGLGFDE